MSEKESTELMIRVLQVPQLEERFRQLNQGILERTAAAMAVVCDEEARAHVKRERTELNKMREAIHEQFKAAEAAVLAPWNEVKASYKALILEPFATADQDLKGKIEQVEGQLKEEKAREVQAYFSEYGKSLDISVPFERSGIKVSLSSSLSALKKEAKTFLDRVAGDMAAIGQMEHAAEILAEYLKSYDLGFSVRLVGERQQQIRDAAAEQERKREREQAEAEGLARVDAAVVEAAILEAPTAVAEQAPEGASELCVCFKVYGTKDRLRALKQFLEDGGYRYE